MAALQPIITVLQDVSGGQQLHVKLQQQLHPQQQQQQQRSWPHRWMPQQEEGRCSACPPSDCRRCC